MNPPPRVVVLVVIWVTRVSLEDDAAAQEGYSPILIPLFY